MTPLSGIYEILNTVNGKRYIGQSADIRARWKGHRFELRRGRSPHEHLQRAWNKYGEPTFVFSVLETCAREKEALRVCEQKWMDALKPEYNKAPAAGSVLGIKFGPPTPAHRANLSAALLGKIPWNKGKPMPQEIQAKLLAANIGRPMSASVRLNLLVINTGRPLSDEHRATISAAKLGKSPSLKTRANMSAARHRRNQATLAWVYAF